MNCPDYYGQGILMHLNFSGSPGCCCLPDTSQRKSACSKITLGEHFFMLKLLPQKMHFPLSAMYQGSTWTARGYFSGTLPKHSLPQQIPPGRHGLVPTEATCCCHCPGSKWDCSCLIRAGAAPPGCSPEPSHTTDKPLTNTDPHSPSTL